jgi:hypothetical protein
MMTIFLLELTRGQPNQKNRSLISALMVRKDRVEISENFAPISDGHRKDDLLCMAILNRKRMDQVGHFLPPAYTGVYSDDEFSFRAFEDGVTVEARDLVLTHEHPNYDSSIAMDETYARQNDDSRYAEAKRIFLERNPGAKKRWFVKDSWERKWVPDPKKK